MKNLLLLLIGIFISSWLYGQSSKSYLGVTSNVLHPSKAEKVGLNEPYGSYITKVSPGTAAANAGLMPFDYITSIGDVKLNKETSLGHALSNYNAGEITTVSIIREGKPMVKNVALGNINERTHDSRRDENNPFLGVYESHKSTGEVIGVPVNVSKNTTADYIGLKDGDILTRIDNYPMVDWHDLGAAVDARHPGDNIEVTAIRGDETLVLSGRIKSEKHNSALDRMIDMEYLEVEIADMEEEETEMVEALLEENISVLSPLGVEDLKLFPNPNIGFFNLTFKVPGTGDVFIMVYSSQGQLIINEQLPDFSGRFNQSYDLGIDPAGTYFLMVRQGDRVMSRKIIVARS